MIKYREILRLKRLRFSERNIARICGASRNTVKKVLDRAAQVGLIWPLDNDLTAPPSTNRKPSPSLRNFLIHFLGKLLRIGFIEHFPS